MADGMLSIVRRLDERKDKYEAHAVVGEGRGGGVVGDCAIAGNCRRCAQQYRPRSVTRGHYPQGSLQEV
jgi:hypothetical protein